ncbi:Bacillosamine/Legionaminic acid biosynthesis aminotransferase PglE / 4-keto-6-deoxy-N-Acetyl-D-hexosaminyl-(Lipid carrier) aminotransferase [Amycolatopsis camponoti]|uniref:Bacillosamine/Legionaminic acid biosynthesis aminotransferase PglE / 4-keto-6-deoxy-N-Acetyl-D-hexosaminyl-(Lipid carrier) aminotransferase n=1 Tax=Amycolatopsis camponoti TaxID=2606593 RepID=A0A6I8M7H3_9PSEU|nr:UDP-4-amino-4,6-dideoxy-N-acetyl-beta-L-altrosamine transaminase [Amycolatopsis camponoti]VVJ23751.1 Bacillosamine/Legionaminic acid biosynthesis aminotransferase PglE / 4-keto-6-deoxy-N-Acetyl-D-hexosaminyl-(Lipid carrier) aminotransferase [Amycolatopsis camponoti]
MPDFLPYGRQSISEEDIQAVVDVLRGDWLTTGPAVQQFENDLAAHTGGAPAVAVTSGTAALHVAYAAAGLKAGDEVVASPMTFVATAATAALHGAKVVFADVEPDTGNLDVEAAKAAMTDRTKVVAAVDYAGHPAELDALATIAHHAGALLLEDAAHSVGGSWQGRPVGSIADLTTFSFFPTKNLTTAEGGAVVTPDAGLLDRARKFRNHGLVRDRAEQRYPDEGGWHQEVHEFGLNYRLPDVLCALGSSQLKRLTEFKKRRAEIHARYSAALADVDGVATPPSRPGADPVWHLYPLRVLEGRRKALFEHLRGAGIGVQVNYIPVYWHPVFEDLGYRRGLCPNAEAYYEQELSLPLFPSLTDADVDRVVDAVRTFFG